MANSFTKLYNDSHYESSTYYFDILGIFQYYVNYQFFDISKSKFNL